MSQATPEGEATMEDILDSIRKAVEAEDWQVVEPEPVIELTRVVKEDGSVVDLTMPTSESGTEGNGEQVSEEQSVSDGKNSDFERPHEGNSFSEKPTPGPNDRLSAAAGSAALSSFISKSEEKHVDIGPQLGSGRTLEGVVREALVPHVRDWLEENLVPLVQNIVREEIERMVRRKDD
ncbi:cell pole-organizing protein PopZ [Limibacillus sp. MBR-115]|jgi:cell pole-organizing protein PopZ